MLLIFCARVHHLSQQTGGLEEGYTAQFLFTLPYWFKNAPRMDTDGAAILGAVVFARFELLWIVTANDSVSGGIIVQ